MTLSEALRRAASSTSRSEGTRCALASTGADESATPEAVPPLCGQIDPITEARCNQPPGHPGVRTINPHGFAVREQKGSHVDSSEWGCWIVWRDEK